MHHQTIQPSVHAHGDNPPPSLKVSGAPPSVGAGRAQKHLAKNIPEITKNGPFQALQRDTMRTVRLGLLTFLSHLEVFLITNLAF